MPAMQHAAAFSDDALSGDRLLGGKVMLRQPRLGFRAALDPVLLAAAVPARTGDAVLEGGSGTGAALLCLAARVPGLSGVGLERDPALAALARANALANGWPGLSFVAADLAAAPLAGSFDHALANPPYHDDRGTASVVPARDAAKRGESGLLAVWATALGSRLRHRGTLTFILPPRLLADGLAAFQAARCPAERMIPLWPKETSDARWIILRGRRGGRAPLTVSHGLVLHDGTGAWRVEANRVLRDAAPLERAVM